MMLACEYGMSKRRVMAKAKVYGFSPWVDQVDAINQIMKVKGPSRPSSGNLLTKRWTHGGRKANQLHSLKNQIMPAYDWKRLKVY